MYRYVWLLLFITLTACSTVPNYAPVSDISQIEAVPKTGVVRVAAGETLYSIAWRYGMDYRALAARNHIVPPYTLRVGQLIYLRGKPKVDVAKLDKKVGLLAPAKTNIAVISDREPQFNVTTWQWPVKGKVVKPFSAFNKGINIASHKGAAVYASAPGKVVYSGSGLRAYGHLIIIKHNSAYLSAYAYNQKVYVKEGDWVVRGQKIAAMGENDAGKPMLHFEIRHAGQPLNPMQLLNF